jgi:hypothetical protein
MRESVELELQLIARITAKVMRQTISHNETCL